MLPLEMKLHGEVSYTICPRCCLLCTDSSAIVFAFIYFAVMFSAIYMVLLSFQADTPPASPVVHPQLSLPEAASLCSDPIRTKLRTFNTHQFPRPEPPLGTLSIPARFTYIIADRENLSCRAEAIDYLNSLHSTLRSFLLQEDGTYRARIDDRASSNPSCP